MKKYVGGQSERKKKKDSELLIGASSRSAQYVDRTLNKFLEEKENIFRARGSSILRGERGREGDVAIIQLPVGAGSDSG